MAGLVSLLEDKQIAKCLRRTEASDCFDMAATYRKKYLSDGRFGDLELAERWEDSAKELMAKGR